MTTYRICAAVVFLFVYAIFHFGFRTGGDGQLYKINDRIAFELQTPNENWNGVRITSYRPTNAFIKFIGGAFQADNNGAAEMPHVNYRSGDYIYTNAPQNPVSSADIINVRTGETINANLPQDFKWDTDVSTLPEYRERGLVAADGFKLDQNYVTANFEPLSTFTNRCVYAHLIFAVAALFMAFPQLFVWVIDALSQAFDPTRPENYSRIGS